MEILRRHAPKLDGCKLISQGKRLVVPATTGTEPLSEPEEGIFFTGFERPRRVSWAVFTSATRRPTPPTPAAVFELRESMALSAICCGDAQRYCFDTYLQIKAFCLRHPEWLRGEWATLFPFCSAGEVLFVDAYVRPDGSIILNTDTIDFPMRWAARHRPWIVVPKTIHH